MLSDKTISAIRARFPIFRRAIYLNSCSQGALSDAVEKSMLELLEIAPRMHKDPADQIVVATARRLGASLMTDDARIRRSRLVPVL